MMSDVTVLPDGSAFCVEEIDVGATPPANPVYWNGYNKVVQDHRDGTIDHGWTAIERAKRNLPPWSPDIAFDEACRPYVP